MLIDTGAQVSLINEKLIPNKSLINTKNKITISSIHGSESTLGNISVKILENNTNITIQLQVTKKPITKRRWNNWVRCFRKKSYHKRT